MLTTAGPDDTSLGRLSVLDWIGAALVTLSGLVSLALPLAVAPMFRRLSESVGADASGGFGRVLEGWLPLVLGLAPLAVVVYALGVRQPVARRRLLLVLAFMLTMLAGVMFLVALYGTLFSMAGAASTGS